MRNVLPKVLVALLVVAYLTGLPAVAHPGVDQQIADLNARIEADPGNASLYLRRGELHRIHRDWALAETDYKRALKLDPEMTVVHRARGRMLLESDRAKEAVAPLAAYLVDHSKDTQTHVLLGRALMRLGRHMDSADSYARALASVGDGTSKPEYYLERARALVAAGSKHTKAAIACLDEGLEKLSYPVTLQLYAMELEIDLKRYDSALARLDQIASRSPRKENWLVQRGEILEQAGRPEQARDAYRLALEAIGALPPSRASNRAVERIREQASTALERLAAVKDTGTPDSSP